jgi:endonuclease YncB( thermonuclease family)
MRRLGIALALSMVCVSEAPTPLLDSSPRSALCVRVIDGDSLVLLLDNGEVEARLRGIDAPERGQPFADRARRALVELVAGQIVEHEVRGSDRYGRVLVRLWVSGTEVNTELVRRGLAWYFMRYSDDPALAAAEREARVGRAGLWSEPDPVPPWAWREHHPRAFTATAPTLRDEEATILQVPPRPGGVFHGNRRSFVYHRPGCINYRCPNCTREFTTREEAEAAGFRPGGCCFRSAKGR